jgi:hypothetical protein
MRKLFQVEVLLCATAYIQAASAEEAAAMAQEAFSYANDATVARRTSFGEVPCSSAPFDRMADEPAVTLSPALTFCGLAADLKTASSPFTAEALACVEEADEQDDDDADVARAKALGYDVSDGMGADGTEFAILDTRAEAFLPERYDTAAEAWSVAARLAPARPEPVSLCVLDIREGDLVDLQGAPGCQGEAFAGTEFELAQCVGAEREAPMVMRLDFEGLPSVGFDASLSLPVIKNAWDPATGAKAPWFK